MTLLWPSTPAPLVAHGAVPVSGRKGIAEFQQAWSVHWQYHRGNREPACRGCDRPTRRPYSVWTDTPPDVWCTDCLAEEFQDLPAGMPGECGHPLTLGVHNFAGVFVCAPICTRCMGVD